MLKKFTTIFPIMIGIFFTNNAYAFDKTYEGTVQDLENLVIEENGIKINNFSFAEKEAFMAKGLANIVVSFSARNKNEVSKHFSAMIVGKSGESILWAVSAEPMMSTISANKTEAVKNDAYITPRVLDETKQVWLRITGDF